MDLREIAEKTACAVENRAAPYCVTIIESALRSVAPRWVPVGEGLPENGTDVQLYSSGWTQRHIGYRSGDDWCIPGVRLTDMRLNPPTHWMPLPPPPEGCE